MTIEQKAKRYDEALKWMRRLYPTMTRIDKEDAEHFFPELRESEDERIKNLIYCLIRDRSDNRELLEHNGIMIEKALAWLEKQGKQSFAIRWHDVSLIPREMEELLVEWDSNDATWHDVAFYHADSKTFWNGKRQVDDVTRWCYIDDLLEKQGEQKPTDEEMKELLRTEYEKGRADAIAEMQVAWSEQDSVRLQHIIDFLWHNRKGDTDAIYQQEQDIDWLKSFRPHNWTKEDKERYISCLKRLSTGNPKQPETINSKWFKEHVYPQKQWKPSKEQMNALDSTLQYSQVSHNSLEHLNSLYNDLKKLTSENYE